MPRFGKGNPMDIQAKGLLKRYLDLSSRHAAKQAQSVRGSRTTGKIHSLRTFEKYTTCLKQAGEWAKATHGLKHLDKLTPAQAQEYLQQRAAQGISQKQLDADRNAIELLTGKGHLERVKALQERTLSGRAYTPAQVEAITRHQDERNGLSTRLAYEAGLRGHELLTLRRQDEERPSGHRQWRAERFLGRDGVRYIVTGKGGLKREVLLSRETAEELEARRLAAPRQITDRGIHYQQYYDLNGGNRWSASFSAASTRALGWSTGAHGLRHAYAQERLEELQRLRMNYYAAREVLSQELGHFRGDVVETYLR
jgi:integrase